MSKEEKKLSRYVWFVNENIYDSMFDMYARYIWWFNKENHLICIYNKWKKKKLIR